MQGFSKFNLEINVAPKRIMCFTINNKLILTNSFQFLSSSLNILIKALRTVILIITVKSLIIMY